MAGKICSPVHGEDKLTLEIKAFGSPELKKLVGEAADREGVSVSEWVVKILAQELGRPDLAVVPRKKMGRPRKEITI